MEYKYYNQFNLSDELSQAISTIISKKENGDYVCKILTFTIPEHKGPVFESPLTNEDICMPGAMALNGAQIHAINEKYGKFVQGTIPEETCAFFVIIKRESYEALSKRLFKSKRQTRKTLQAMKAFYRKYDGIFDSMALCKRFPYLKEFFTSLDNWRAQTGRVTIDDDVLIYSKNKTLSKKI